MFCSCAIPTPPTVILTLNEVKGKNLYVELVLDSSSAGVQTMPPQNDRFGYGDDRCVEVTTDIYLLIHPLLS